MTTDELLEYQRGLYVVASEAAEKVRRQGGSARAIAEEFDRVVHECGWPEPRVRV